MYASEQGNRPVRRRPDNDRLAAHHRGSRELQPHRAADLRSGGASVFKLVQLNFGGIEDPVELFLTYGIFRGYPHHIHIEVQLAHMVNQVPHDQAEHVPHGCVPVLKGVHFHFHMAVTLAQPPTHPV